MPTAPSPAGLPSQTHQGGGARVLQCIRSVIALTSRLRRPPAPRSGGTSPTPQDKPAPSKPRRKHTPRQPRAAAPVSPARSGWFARWFGPKRRQPAQSSGKPAPDSGNPFTPEAYPGLPPEVCAFLNTPVKDCDPDLLRVVLAALARHIADSLPPGRGTDVQTLFSTLCGRLGAMPEQPGPDVPQAEQPAPAQDAEPDVSPEPLLQPAPEPNAEPQTTPDAAPLTEPGFRRVRPSPDRSWSFRHRRRSRDCHRARVHRLLRDGPQRQPPRRLCYAACAGPP